MSKIIGIVGGIGSGKSEVAKIFEKSGAVVLNADKIGHEILFLDSVKEIARKRWGETIFDSNSEIDRRKLAAIVFEQTEKGAEELHFLTEMTHPLIAKELRRQMAAAEQNGENLIILDAPLLFEANWNHLVSNVIFVDVPESIRWERVKSRGWTWEEFRSREATQWPVEQKNIAADIIISNAGSYEELVASVQKILLVLSRKLI